MTKINIQEHEYQQNGHYTLCVIADLEGQEMAVGKTFSAVNFGGKRGVKIAAAIYKDAIEQTCMLLDLDGYEGESDNE